MKVTGQTLRENREKQGLTINEVAIMIKINTKTVRAIEDGDVDNLPAKTFLRGFIRSYAHYLKLDVPEILATFQEEMGSTKPKYAIRDQNNEEKRKKAIAESMQKEDAPVINKVAWSVTGVIAVILIAFVFGQVEKYERESQAPPISPDLKAIDPTDAPVAEEPLPGTDGVPTEPPSELAAEQSAATPPTGAIEKTGPVAESTIAPPTKTQTKTQPTSSIPLVHAPPHQLPVKVDTAESKPPPVAEKNEVKVVVVPEKQPAEKKSILKHSLASQEIILEAFGKVTVTYSFNGKASSTLNLKGDEIRVIKGSGPIRMSISDGGSVNLVHNGKDLGVPGSLGSPVNLSLQ